ncbi:MAG: N-6 DNA methylase [Candidatus Poseidoniaceae archaeon]
MSNVKITAMKNIMRVDAGVNGNIQRIETIGWMLFLKIWDTREQELELTEDGFISPLVDLQWTDSEGTHVADDLRWRSWAADREGITGENLRTFVNNQLFPAIKGMVIPPSSENYNIDKLRKRLLMIRQCFSDMNNYMTNGTAMRDLINYIHANIGYDTTEQRDEFGNMYESFLHDLQSAKDSGEFYTPRAVTDFIIEMLDPQLGDSILDPAAGTGGFLCSAIRYINANYVTPGSIEDHDILSQSINGIEKKALPTLLCMTNLIHHGIDEPGRVRRGNSLTKPIHSYTEDDEVEIIVTNPPFGGSEQDSVLSNFPLTYRVKETADLFMTVIHTYLSNGGRAAVIYPETPSPIEKSKQRIVRRLVEECNLHTIIQLPNSTFKPYAAVATNILFFVKGTPTSDTWFYQHKVPDGQKNYSKTKPIKSRDLEPIKLWWGDREESENSWRISIQDIIDSDYAIFDWKNPNIPEDEYEAADSLMEQYREQTEIVDSIKSNIIDILREILEV